MIFDARGIGGVGRQRCDGRAHGAKKLTISSSEQILDPILVIQRPALGKPWVCIRWFALDRMVNSVERFNYAQMGSFEPGGSFIVLHNIQDDSNCLHSPYYVLRALICHNFTKDVGRKNILEELVMSVVL